MKHRRLFAKIALFLVIDLALTGILTVAGIHRFGSEPPAYIADADVIAACIREHARPSLAEVVTACRLEQRADDR